MQSKFLKEVEEAYIARDLKALDALALPRVRTLNTTSNFSSVLMLSSNNFKHLCKIEELKADSIMLNLEDGVAKEEKPFALVLCAIFLSLHQKSNKKLVVRVNALEEGGYEEITYLNQFSPDAIRVPKIKNTQEVKNVLALLNPQTELHLSIETAEAWHNLSTLALHPKVTTFYLGILDLFADMKLSHNLIERHNPTMLYMLSHFLVTCKSMGVKPVSFVYQEFQNLIEFGKWISLEKNMGFNAKGCISPKQAEMVNLMFINEEAQINRAKIIIKLFEMHQEMGVTGFVDEEYGFIDEPIYKGALALLKEL
jgi:citrate lyase subunit beta/citryl-CoA lyase